MSNNFKRVVVVHNPNSTGDSEKNAEVFIKSLKSRVKSIDIVSLATEFAGHARELARDYAADPSTVIVSSSGDGGYNEIVNGVLDSGGKAATAVLPSGNANDHHASVESGDLIDNIVNAKVRGIETIEVAGKVDGKDWVRFAHSYAGFGMTPKIGRVLTEQRPNVWTEKWYVLKHTLRFHPVSLLVNGRRRRYGNLIFATIGRMSKVVKLDDDASLHDGKMEVYATEYLSLFGILKLIISASVHGIRSEEKTKRFVVQTLKPTLIQLDGEVFTLDGDCTVTLRCRKDSLRTVV